MHDSPRCPGVLVVHLDKTVTCTSPDCEVFRTFNDMISGHCMFVTCDEDWASTNVRAVDMVAMHNPSPLVLSACPSDRCANGPLQR